MSTTEAQAKFWSWHLNWLHADATSAVASWSAYAGDCYRDYLRCVAEGRDAEAGTFAAEERRALREAAKYAGIAAGYASRATLEPAGDWPWIEIATPQPRGESPELPRPAR